MIISFYKWLGPIINQDPLSIAIFVSQVVCFAFGVGFGWSLKFLKKTRREGGGDGL